MIKSAREFLRATNGIKRCNVRPRCEMDDGYSISIQASESHYCFPKCDFHNSDFYESVELGMPSMKDNIIDGYAIFLKDEEDIVDNDYLETVYPNVPIEVVDELINKHGGIVRLVYPV